MLSPIYSFLLGDVYHLCFYTQFFCVFIFFNTREVAPHILTSLVLSSWCYCLHCLLRKLSDCVSFTVIFV